MLPIHDDHDEAANVSADGADAPTPPSGWDRRRDSLHINYEQAALQLFAARGYGAVTYDEIATEAGTSTRTLFRYFPSKEDFLLGLPRRGVMRLVAHFARLAPSDTPLVDAWWLLRDDFLKQPMKSEVLVLWRAASIDAPEVVSRARGERIEAMTAALIDYSERSLGAAAPPLDIHIASGVIAGAEATMLDAWGRLHVSAAEIVDAADRAVGSLDLRRASFSSQQDR
jgi:AcrR family transcriptional regulator